MSRLPLVGQDDNAWGDILNDFLSQSLNSDGSLKASSITVAGGEQTSNKGRAGGYASLDGSAKVPVALLPANALSLAGSNDVTITAPSDGQLLAYDSASSTWQNTTIASAPVTSVAGKTGAVSLVESDVANLTSDLAAINLGTVWPSGDNVSVYTSNNPSPSKADIRSGTSASPDTVYGPVVKVSRTLNIPEASFSGDGGVGLAAINGTTIATSASESQAVGVTGGATTFSDFVGTHSQADAIGGYFVGRAATGATRTGIGAFLNGRREDSGGRATGVEISCDNESGVAGSYNSTTYSDTQGIWIHATGTADAGCGIQFGHNLVPMFKVGIGFNSGAIADSSIRDDSSATTSLDIRGTHTNAILLAAGAGIVDLGSNQLTGLPSGTATSDAATYGQLKSAAAPYKTINQTTGNANTSAASSTKYFMIPGQTNVSAPNPQSNAAVNYPYLLNVAAADFAGLGTTKMRVSAIAITGTAPAITITLGLYPVTGGSTQSLGTVVSGSTVAFASPGANSNTTGNSGDFTVPSDGVYALGFVVSGTPSAGFALQAKVEYHNV